jgi:hypothetical protein
VNKKGYDKRGYYLLFNNIFLLYFIINIVAQAKQMIKSINFYVNDYEIILENYKNEKQKN